MAEGKAAEPKMQNRFGFLWRELYRLSEANQDQTDPGDVRRLLADVRDYMSKRDEALPPQITPFFIAFQFRNAGRALLGTASGRAWEKDVAEFVESLPAEEVLPNGVRFSSDFVSRFSINWLPALAHLVGAPNVNALEVGSAEGRSCLWFLANVLTDRSSRITCIDTFDGAGQGRSDIESELQSRFDRNAAAAGETDRVTKIFGMSQVALRTLPLGHYDFAYIDGSHMTADVLEDIVLAWRLLQPNGVMILDDYGYFRMHPTAPPEVRPSVAIDAFMTCFAGQWTEVHRDYQIILKKNA
ncbi:MAG TPA: class I SAM-dependent methyltransferase [Kofleriaceae bacterium]|jgi:predicted O-methyltransferase YrrM